MVVYGTDHSLQDVDDVLEGFRRQVCAFTCLLHGRIKFSFDLLLYTSNVCPRRYAVLVFQERHRF